MPRLRIQVTTEPGVLPIVATATSRAGSPRPETIGPANPTSDEDGCGEERADEKRAIERRHLALCQHVDNAHHAELLMLGDVAFDTCAAPAPADPNSSAERTARS